MPEQCELMLMRDYLNNFNNLEVIATHKSNVTKIQTPNIKNTIFKGAVSRGKELMLEFTNHNYVFTMGMSGNWTSVAKIEDIPKHTHFYIETTGPIICMVDPRRFAKWKIGEFNPDRGPDLMSRNYDKFLWTKLEDKIFSKPLYDIMLDQRYFNGLGNYIRSEVIYRTDINPFLEARKLLKNRDTFNHFISIIKTVCIESYKIGGGEFKNFKNPNSDNEIPNLGKWMQCYGKKEMGQILDSKKRTFWFNPKYKI
jgi:endonuclease VIII-like 1